MAVTEAQVIDALRPVEDPELHRSIVDLGMVRDVVIDGGSVTVVVALTIAGCPLRAEIDRRVRDAVVALDGVDAAAPEFTVMTDEERAKVREIMQGDPASTAGSQAAHGHAEGRAIPFAQPGSRTRVLLIASGKGGVGKSSVTTNLAVALARRDKSVAVIDADVWGFSIPRMLGIDRPPVVVMAMGLDSSKEEMNSYERLFLARGLATLTFDGPGQGEGEYEFAIRPDYEAPVGAVLDWLELRDDIDAARAGLWGVSLGGYYVPRAAGFEHRLGIHGGQPIHFF